MLRNMLHSLKIELLETTCKHVSINMIVAKSIQNELMGEQSSTVGVRGVKNIVRDCRDTLKNIVKDCRDTLEGTVRD